MIDWSEIRIEKAGSNLLVFHGKWEDAKLLLELVPYQNKSSVEGARYLVKNAKTSQKLGSVIQEKTGFAIQLMAILEGLTCEVCHVEWGPVCARCFDQAGDETYLLYRSLLKGTQARVDDRRDGKTVHELLQEES